MSRFARGVEPLNAEHICHAIGCARPIPRSLLMCVRHWRMVPRDIQKLIWRHYRRGQESDGKPITPEYLDAVKRAIRDVAEQEGLA